MAHKTKAAMQGRQCHYTKLVRGQNTTLIDQVNRCDFYRFTGEVLTPPLAEFDRVCISGVTGIPVSVGYQALPYTLEYYESFVVQPFGSMPRCCSSLRMMRLIQAASDSSPSCRCASSIESRSSGSSRNWNGGFPRLSFLCVDTFSTPDVVCLCVMTHYMHMNEKATPRSAETLPRRLTKPLYEVTIMADIHSTQTRSEFTWRFFALARADLDGEIYRLSVDATTEQEARRVLAPHFILSLAARLPVRGHHA